MTICSCRRRIAKCAFDEGTRQVFDEVERCGGQIRGAPPTVVPFMGNRLVFLLTPATRGTVFSVIGFGRQWLVRPGVA